MKLKRIGSIPKICPKIQFFKIPVPGLDNQVPTSNPRLLNTQLHKLVENFGQPTTPITITGFSQ
jgi:hypothetical protein